MYGAPLTACYPPRPSAALLYGAPNSPLVQPRNVILGSSLAAAIAVGVQASVAAGALPRYVAVPLAPALALAVTQRVGLLHPPAGAAALIFVIGEERITSLGLLYLVLPLLVGNLLCVLVAMTINNASHVRQYPVWY